MDDNHDNGEHAYDAHLDGISDCANKKPPASTQPDYLKGWYSYSAWLDQQNRFNTFLTGESNDYDEF